MNRTTNLLWGIIFIVAGIIFGLNALEITNINIFFDGWWTLFIIVPCFIGLFKEEDKQSDLIGFVIGICLLLGCLDIISFDLIWKLLIPTVLVIIGLSFIFKDAFRRNIKEKINTSENKEYCATFGSQTIDFSKEEFKGCSLTAVFGEVKCNLKDAIIKEDIIIKVSSIFGGTTIYIPENVNVKSSSTSIFGGILDDRKNKTKDAKNTIYVEGITMFGGIKIK